MLRILAGTASLAALACLFAPDLDAQGRKKGRQASGSQWVEGVSYTTDWQAAIKEVQQSGKMLFIYNGWQRKGI